MNSALREPLAPPADASAAQADVDRHVAVQPLASAIYEGWVRHRRHAPRAHAFRYRMAMLYLDLAELPALFAGRWLWSSDRRNVAEFRRGDYLGPAELPLDEAVRRRVAEHTCTRPTGPIRLQIGVDETITDLEFRAWLDWAEYMELDSLAMVRTAPRSRG